MTTSETCRDAVGHGLTKRAALALVQAVGAHGRYPMPKVVFNQLLKRGLVYRALYDYSVGEWGEVGVRVLPVGILTPAGEALARTLVDERRGRQQVVVTVNPPVVGMKE
jgi:hypothetical protein